MADVNGTDHLVRHEKDKLKGFDNDGYHRQEKTAEEEESTSDDDRLRVVVTENGHRPEDDPPLPNGYGHEESNGHAVNGSAVVVLEEDMEDGHRDNSSDKPCDTRLHHYVPVEDMDRRILNGSENTHVSIPEDAVISFSTGRIRVKKSPSGHEDNDRESIPLETMLPAYDSDEKPGLGEKADLEAELSNHKNGVWSSEGHTYGASEGPFNPHSEKLNGTSKASDEVSLPVSNHRKCLSREGSISSCSERKSTGEKLYFTEDSRKFCPGWRRILICGLILIIIAVGLLLGVLAATGILLAESENKNTRYESLPSIDSVSIAGHSFRKGSSASELPPNVTTPKVSGGGPVTVSRPPPTVTSKVPVLNDTSHSQTIVPNALVGEFTITNEDFTDDLNDNTSEGFSSLATHLERELQRIFKSNHGSFVTLKILNFKPGSVKVKFVVIWRSDNRVILANRASEIMASYFHQKQNLILAFRVDVNSVHFIDVFDECRVQKGGCAHECAWNYDTLSKTCVCEKNMVLLMDGKSCGPAVITSVPSSISSKKPYELPTTTSIPETTPRGIKLDTTKELLTTVEQEVSRISEEISTLPNILTTTIAQFSHKPLITESTTESILTEKEETVFPTTKVPLKSFVTEIKEQTLLSKETTTKTPATEIVNTVKETITETTDHFSDLGRDYDQITTKSSLPITEYPLETTNAIFTETTSPEFFPPTESIISELKPDEITTLKIETTTEQLTTIEHAQDKLETIITDHKTEATTVESETTVPVLTENKTNILFGSPTTDSYMIDIENATSYELSTITTSSDDNVKTTLMSDVSTISKDLDKHTKEHEIETTLPHEITKFSETETTPFQTSEGSLLENGDTTLFMQTDSSIHGSTVPNKFLLETTTELPKIYVKIEDNSLLTTTETPFLSKDEANVTSPTVHTSEGIFDLYNTTESIEYLPTKEDEKDMKAYSNITFEPTTTPLDTAFPVEDETTIKYGTETEATINIFSLPNVTETLLEVDTATQNARPITVSEEVDISTHSQELNLTELSATSAPLNFSDFNESISTLAPEISSQSGIILHLNRTPEVRLFDNFTDLDTLKNNLSLSEVETTTLETETEIVLNTSAVVTSFEDNITTTETPPVENTKTEVLLPEKTEMLITSLESNTTPKIYFNSTFNPTVTSIDTTEISAERNGSIVRNTEITSVPESTAETTVDHLTSIDTYVTNIDTTPGFPIDIVTNLEAENITSINLTEAPMNIETATSGSEAEILYTIQSMQNNVSESVDTLAGNLTTNFEIFGSDVTSSTFSVESTTKINFETTNAFDVINSSVTLSAESDLIAKSSEKNDTLDESRLMSLNISENIAKNTTFEVENNVTEPITFSDMNHTIASTEFPTSNFTDITSKLETTSAVTLMELFPTPPFLNFSDTDNSSSLYDSELMTIAYGNESLSESIFYSNFSQNLNYSNVNVTSLMPEENMTIFENSTDLYSNFTTDGFEMTNETTTNVSTGIECREDQFLCMATNVCLNRTLICDGILDCPDGIDEFSCHESCQSNFMCSNTSSRCIMSDARCDGIWDCENGTDEENCTPMECAKHEVMCLDGSKCIKPGHICDWNYNCNDRSDEVGCVERTTCEQNGKFFCNDGLCIPWSLKCDGEFDCKDKEDEGNCTCLSDEFQCNDGKCLKSSMRCDGHQDCHDADDEMGCVNVDSQHIVTTYESYSGTWALLCAEDWKLDDGQYLCQELGFGHALKTEKVHVSFNGTWMAMRRDNLTDSSLWTERVSFVESCTSSLAAAVECQKFVCGEYSGLLHRRRKREALSSSSIQWPFIGYASTYHSKRGCLAEILTPIWLITSADCLLSISKAPHNGSDWFVRTNLGRNLDVDTAQNHEVLRIVTHPHSSKYRSLTLRDYDVALIRLKHALVFVTDKIGAICPPDEQVPSGITCFSGVLGSEKPRAPPPQSLTINSLALQIIDRKNCNTVDHYHGEINSRMICTQSSEGHVICDNDEGTPLMCLSGITKWFLAGMLTYERYCDVYNKHPAVFSNLFAMRNFLDKVTGQKQYETPYDNNVYVIIPPTTPSPTLPETTTEMLSTTFAGDAEFMMETATKGYESANMTNVTEVAEMTLPTAEYGENFTETVPEEILETTTISDVELVENATLGAFVELNISTTNFSEEFGAEENFTSLTVIDSSEDNLMNITTSVSSLDMTETVTRPTNDTTEMLSRTIPSQDYKSELLQDSSLETKTNDSLISSNDMLSEINLNATDVFAIENITNTNESMIHDETTPFYEIVASSSNPDDKIPKAELLSLTTEYAIPTELQSIYLQNGSKAAIENISEISEATFSPKSVSSESLETHTAFEVTTTPYNVEDTTSVTSFADTNNTEIAHTDSITFEMAGEPYSDLEFSVFGDSEGIKVHYTPLLENKTALNDSDEYLSKGRNLEVLPISNISESTEMIAGELQTMSDTLSSDNYRGEELHFLGNVTKVFDDNLSITTVESSESFTYSETPPESSASVTNTENPVVIEQPAATSGNESIPASGIMLTTEFAPVEKYITEVEKSLTSEKSAMLKDGSVKEINESSSVQDMTFSSEETTMVGVGLNESITTVQSMIETNPSMVTTSVLMDGANASGITESTVSDKELFTTLEPIQEFDLFMPANESTLSNQSSEKYFRKYTADEELISEMDAKSEVNITSGRSGETEAFEVTPYSNISEKSSYENFPTEATVDISTMLGDIAENFTLQEYPGIEFHSTFNDTDGCGIWDQDKNITTIDSMNFFSHWPALGFLQMISEPKMCASTVVSAHHVITSLNCLLVRDDQLDPNNWVYVGGLHDESSSTTDSQSHLVMKIVQYPVENFTSPSLLFNKGDLALVRMKDEIKQNKYSKPACLPLHDVQTNETCFAVGWSNSTLGDDKNTEFYSVPVTIISPDKCNSTTNYSGELLGSFICVQHKNESFRTCQMSVGSPLFCHSESERWEIQGVLNVDSPCDMEQLAVYESVSGARQWLDDTLSK